MRFFQRFLYYYYGIQYSKSIIVDKKPSFINKLSVIKSIFPNAKFIHIVRDGRDTYLSFKKKNAPSIRNINVASFEWAIKMKIIEHTFDNCKNFMEIRYEDLISNPTEILKNLCNFINIEYEETMLSFWEKSKNFIDTEH